GCLVGTYGSGPQGVHVHANIVSLPDSMAGPVALAQAIRTLFWARGAVSPPMGALVVGVDPNGNGVVARVVQTGVSTGLLTDIHDGPVGGGAPANIPLQVAATAELTLTRMHQIQHGVAATNPGVGPPY